MKLRARKGFMPDILTVATVIAVAVLVSVLTGVIWWLNSAYGIFGTVVTAIVLVVLVSPIKIAPKIKEALEKQG
ncbi:hypothetical protein AGMMS50276_31140 [Synergistales bacterium]|nr:hypothetical protein AGMMS50276_31140 [Synergistales bacterium]